MNIAVISYSYSGNNEALAESVAKELSAEHIKVVLQKPIKKVITILFGFIFNSSPEVQPPPEIIKKYDFVLFFAPVWMGHVAYPLRRYLNHLKKNPKPYGFLSISGGSMGEITKLPDELLQRTGMEPAILLDQHIKPLFPPGTNPTLMKVATYQINEEDLKKLTDIAVDSIRKVLFPDNN